MTEILVKFHERTKLREINGGLEAKPLDLKAFEADVAATKGAKFVRCFDGDVNRMQRRQVEVNSQRAKRGDKNIPSLDLFVRVRLPDTEDVDSWIAKYGDDPTVEYATLTRQTEGPSPTPDLTGFQGYLESDGVNARSAWPYHGGAGCGVRVCVCEQGFMEHEDLPSLMVVSNRDDNLTSESRHGTRSLGVLFARRDAIGVTGICYDATPLFASSSGQNDVQCINDACEHLEAGDVLVIEMQIVLPLRVPAEWSPDIHAACAMATARGITVVAAAGNGERDLNTERDACGRLIWNRESALDSGAIIVGAGASPLHAVIPARGIKGSCHGSRVNCQAWGGMVTTTGAGVPVPVFARIPGDDMTTYSEHFGTSSATAMIAGAVACLQGIYKHHVGTPLAPGVIRSLLSDPANGSPQADSFRPAADMPIGPLPDLAKLIRAIGV